MKEEYRRLVVHEDGKPPKSHLQVTLVFTREELEALEEDDQ